MKEQRCPQCLTEYPSQARFCAIDGTPLVVIDGSDPLVGTKLDGRYLVLKWLGKGAAGAVYEGLQLSIDRPVAIKLLHHVRGDSHRHRQRFWMEARTVSRLEHPNVVRIYDYGKSRDDVPFLVMELLKGRVLMDLIHEKLLPLSPHRAAQILNGTAKGLAAAHRLGLIHRDVKPGNIWLAEHPERSGDEVVKVIDFGLSRIFPNPPK